MLSAAAVNGTRSRPTGGRVRARQTNDLATVVFTAEDGGGSKMLGTMFSGPRSEQNPRTVTNGGGGGGGSGGGGATAAQLPILAG